MFLRKHTFFLITATLWLAGITQLLMGESAICMNLSRPYDIPLKPALSPDARGVVALLAEKGVGKAHGFDEFCNTNVLRIWNPTQDAIAMLRGFNENSKQGQLLDKIQGVDVAPVDNNNRGHFCVSGDLDLRYNVGFAYRHCLPLNFSIGLYLPVYSLELKNVSWQDLTNPAAPADADRRVKQYLTDNFFANIDALGDGLQLGCWQRTGIGDLVVLVEWLRDFPQQKPLLKNVRLNARLGPSLPTGKRTDEDKVFALSFGNDGALGVIFGGGFVLDWGCYVQAGVDVQLLHIFGNTRDRRIKTSVDQTDLLLLQKACTYKDWGLTQQFNLFLQAQNFYRGWMLMADYQFTKHNEDHVSVISEEFSSEIANTAVSLQDWTAHYFIAKIGYDFGYDCQRYPLSPSLSLYAKAPFNGKNTALFTTVGVILAAQF